MEPVAIVTALVLLEYFWIVWMTGQARGRGGVPAPAMSGDPVFERWLRVQLNTVEQLVIFLPALWMFAFYVHVSTAAALGVVFMIGRLMFARGYVEDPAKRGPGFIVTLASSMSLLLGGLIGAAVAALS
jgi:glutathione S-transferase